jgi:ADP-heptose:LPS heptosyltransferase
MERPITVLDAFRLGDAVYTAALAITVRRSSPERRIQVVASKAAPRLPFWVPNNVSCHAARFPWLENQLSPRCWWELVRTCKALRTHTHGTEGWDVRGDPRQRLVLRLLGCSPIRSVAANRDSRYWWKGEHLEHLAETRQRFLDAFQPGLRLAWPLLQPTRVESERLLLVAPEASNPLREFPSAFVEELMRLARAAGWRALRITERNPQTATGCAPSPSLVETASVWRGSLDELSTLLGQASAVVAADSFVGHYAAAHGLPVVSLFGPALERYVRPWGSTCLALPPFGAFPCRPCRQTTCHHPDFITGEPVCMRSFEAQRVWEYVLSLASTTASQNSGNAVRAS